MLSRTDQMSSTECDRCPYADHAVLSIQRQDCADATLLRATRRRSFGILPTTVRWLYKSAHCLSSLSASANFASIGQLLNDLTIDLSLGIYEANEVSLGHR